MPSPLRPRFHRIRPLLSALCTLILLGGPLSAEVKLASLYRDGAILQRETPIPVWGQATPGEKISVQLATDTVATVAGDGGKWLVHLPARSADTTPVELIVQGTNRVVVRDVLIGDVWLCGGQSNMMMAVHNAMNAEQEIAAANQPLLRLFTVGSTFTSTPATEVSGEWRAALPEHVGKFSATAYFFGRIIQRELGVPVGLIASSYGNTTISTWRSSTALEKHPFIAEWWKIQQRAKTPPRPHRQPGSGFNGMIAPLAPYAVRGIIWYQGEGDATETTLTPHYSAQFADLIREWRELFGRGEPLPFYWVQLAGYGRAAPRDWTGAREQQTLTLAVPNTGQAIAIDLGDAIDIHPRNKQEVGRRLARLALKRTYGRDVIDSGPTALRAESINGSVVVHFDQAALTATGDLASAFELAGADGKFVAADHVEISESTVIVSSNAVRHPTTVRFAWQDLPQGFLYGAEQLPVAPFRLEL